MGDSPEKNDSIQCQIRFDSIVYSQLAHIFVN